MHTKTISFAQLLALLRPWLQEPGAPGCKGEAVALLDRLVSHHGAQLNAACKALGVEITHPWPKED